MSCFALWSNVPGLRSRRRSPSKYMYSSFPDDLVFLLQTILFAKSMIWDHYHIINTWPNVCSRIYSVKLRSKSVLGICQGEAESVLKVFFIKGAGWINSLKDGYINCKKKTKNFHPYLYISWPYISWPYCQEKRCI